MMTAEQFAAHLRELGYDVSSQAVKYHSRLGRCGTRFGRAWAYDREQDTERIVQYLGKVGRPRIEEATR